MQFKSLSDPHRAPRGRRKGRRRASAARSSTSWSSGGRRSSSTESTVSWPARRAAAILARGRAERPRAGKPGSARCTSARRGCRCRARQAGEAREGLAGAAQHPQRALPVRTRCHSWHGRSCALPRTTHAAAILQGLTRTPSARRTRGTRRACRRRRLPQIAGGLRAARVLRREHGTFGPVDLGARTGLAARPHRPGEGRGGLRGQGVRCRPHLLRDQRHLHRQQDRLALDGRARRPGDRRPQLPQEPAALADHDRRRRSTSRRRATTAASSARSGSTSSRPRRSRRRSPPARSRARPRAACASRW